jgi:hypothetical protein
MPGSKYNKIAALLSTTALLASVAVAHAQVTKDDAKCRATAHKHTAKLTAAASKAIAGCWKNVLADKRGFTNCNDSTTADVTFKVPKAANKLIDAVGGGKTKCSDVAHSAALAEYRDCPSPGSQGTGMTTFAQVGLCLREVGQGMADNMHRAAMNPGAKEVAQILADTVNGKQIAKCGNSIQKSFNRLIAAIGKVEGRQQTKILDKAMGPYDYAANGADPKFKIAAAVSKLNRDIAKKCSGLSQGDFSLLRTCGDLTTVATCLEKIAKNGSGGVTAASFEMPGNCPARVVVTGKPRQSNGDNATATSLDAGWVGFGHGADLVTFAGEVNLACTDGTCSDCTVTASCGGGNCRCDSDRSIECDQPFEVDEDDCGAGEVCSLFFGSPLPLSAGGSPTCVETILINLSGTADVGTGASSTLFETASKVHTGISQDQPCPVCVNGFCDAGERDGMACTDDGVSPTFGATSFDCPPDPITNVSGGGLSISLLYSNTPAALNANVPCSLVNELFCHCQQCSGDIAIACNSNAECAAAGAGTCTANTGHGNLPNSCEGSCVVDADGHGECDAAGPTASFCDGFTHPDGSGIITCNSDADCAEVGAFAGNCTVATPQRCFGNSGEPISVVGTFASPDAAVLGSTFCIPPTNSSAINGAAGTPGPGRLRVAWDFEGFCSDGETPFTLGGTVCP